MIIAVFKTIFVEYTEQISLLSVTQFTVENLDFELLTTTDRSFFCITSLFL